MKSFLSTWLPVIVWSAVIYFLSSQPSLRLTDNDFSDFLFRKSAHFLEYLILAWLFVRALFRSHPDISSGKLTLLTLLFSLFFAISDELHQSFVPGRQAHIRDVVIDVSGAFFGAKLFLRRIGRAP